VGSSCAATPVDPSSRAVDTPVTTSRPVPIQGCANTRALRACVPDEKIPRDKRRVVTEYHKARLYGSVGQQQSARLSWTPGARRGFARQPARKFAREAASYYLLLHRTTLLPGSSHAGCGHAPPTSCASGGPDVRARLSHRINQPSFARTSCPPLSLSGDDLRRARASAEAAFTESPAFIRRCARGSECSDVLLRMPLGCVRRISLKRRYFMKVNIMKVNFMKES
jgi:hypothetical protein